MSQGDGKGVTVGILGAGSIAFGTAALLAERGHAPMVWSPSGRGTSELASTPTLKAHKAIEGDFPLRVATSAQEVVSQNDVLVLAVPGYGHKPVLDAIAPHLRDGQPVVISSHMSFGALYLSRLLAARGVSAPIVAWGTTVVTGRRTGPREVMVNTVRDKVDFCAVPAGFAQTGGALCRALFGDRFVERSGLLAITLSNVNPQNHYGIALCNMTRMERAETWNQGENVTPNVGRLLEALDGERLAIADALGLSVRTIFEHFHLSFQVPVDTVSNMNQEMARRGRGGTGPATAESRYVLEDVPFGLVGTAKVGRLAGRPAHLHEAGIAVFSALYGRDFTLENDLLDALEFDRLSRDDLERLSRDGYDAVTSPDAEG